MQPKIIVGIFARVTDGEQIFSYLLTTAPYHDPALESQIVGGTAWPVIQSDATFDIGESIQFQPQGGNSGASIGSVPIDNTGGQFDAWMRYNFAGMEWTIKRGFDNQSWAEFELIFEAEGRGRPELNGQEIIVPLRDKFGYMREPVAQEVFDENTANPSLINTTAPMVFGEVFQVEPKLVSPSVLAYFSADNLAQTYSVAEGGNTETPQWVELPQGAQLLANPSLIVTTDIAGPPAEISGADDDVLAGAGQFDSWDNGELDYPGLTVETTAGADLIEGAESDSGIIELAPVDLLDTGWVVGQTLNYVNADAFNDGRQWQTNSTTTNATIADIEIAGGNYAEARLGGRGGGQYQRSNQMRISNLGLNVPAGATIEGIEILTRINVSSTTPQETFFYRLGVVLPGGITLQGDAQGSPTGAGLSFSDVVTGGDDDLWGGNTELLTPEVVNSASFTYVISVRATGAMTNQVTLGLDHFAIKVYYTEAPRFVRLRWADVMELGERYTVTIDSVDETGSLLADWTDSVDSQDPQSARTALITSASQFSYVFTAGQEDFDLYFRRGDNGDQEIASITLRKGSSARNRYHELIRYLHETAGRDPDVVCDNDSLALVQAQADNPRMGWYVSDQTTREQLSTFFSHSLAAVSWGGIDGKWKAAQMQVPKQPDGEYLAITQSFSEPSAVPDYAEDLRDRAHAAKNFRPITEAEAAGVTTNWSRSQQEQIKAEWRITERADFDNLIDYDGPTP